MPFSEELSGNGVDSPIEWNCDDWFSRSLQNQQVWQLVAYVQLLCEEKAKKGLRAEEKHDIVIGRTRLRELSRRGVNLPLVSVSFS